MWAGEYTPHKSLKYTATSPTPTEAPFLALVISRGMNSLLLVCTTLQTWYRADPPCIVHSAPLYRRSQLPSVHCVSSPKFVKSQENEGGRIRIQPRSNGNPIANVIFCQFRSQMNWQLLYRFEAIFNQLDVLGFGIGMLRCW